MRDEKSRDMSAVFGTAALLPGEEDIWTGRRNLHGEAAL